LVYAYIEALCSTVNPDMTLAEQNRT